MCPAVPGLWSQAQEAAPVGIHSKSFLSRNDTCLINVVCCPLQCYLRELQLPLVSRLVLLADA